MAKIGVTVNVEEEVWRRSRAIAILNQLTISSVIEKFLREWSGMEGSNGDTEAEPRTEALGEDPEDGVRHGTDGH